MTIAPYPPIPLISGPTTPGAAATPTAASNAFPPSARISSPAFVASGCAELTMPLVPIAGRVAVFLLAGPSTGSGSDSDRARCGVCPVVSSSLVPSDAVVSAAGTVFCVVRFSGGAPSFWALDCTPQEHRIPTISATMSDLLKKCSPKDTVTGQYISDGLDSRRQGDYSRSGSASHS